MKIHHFFSLLSVRIFLVFIVYCSAIVAIAVMLPTLDQGKIRAVPQTETEMLTQRLQRELTNVKLISNAKRPHLKHVIAIPKTEDSDAFNDAIHKVKNVHYRKFILAVFDEKKPHQQMFDSQMILGPLEIEPFNYQFYIIAPKLPQSYYVVKLLNSPTLLFFIMIFASLPFIFLLTYLVYRPIKSLKQASERVAQGDWETDPNLEKGTMEFSQLGQSFNHMVLALQQAEAEKNRLFANMSHELRTPLTRIRLTNGMLRRKSNQTLAPDIERIEHNVVLIEDRIQAMLSLSRKLILNREKHQRISLKNAMMDLLAEAQFEAEANNKSLVYQAIPEVQLSLNQSNFQSGIENILRNAIHYAQHETRILFHVNSHELTIEIQDDGMGVQSADLERLFEPFYRSENSQVADSHGAGLGLAIAKQMVKSHGGKITAKNNEDHGLTISIFLPLIT